MTRRTRTRAAQAVGIGAVAAAALVGAAPPSWSAATTEIERYHQDLPGVELTPNCADEAIAWEGGYDVVITTTRTPNGVTRSLNYVQKMTGTGLESGDHYSLSARYHEITRDPVRGAQVYLTSTTYVQISGGSGQNYLFQGVDPLVVNARGVPILDLEEDEHYVLRCTG